MKEMKVDWNFVPTLRHLAMQYVKNAGFRDFLKGIIGLKAGARVLDVGCGIGSVPRLLFEMYGTDVQIHGVDIDKGLIAWGNAHWGLPENIHLQKGDAHGLEFPNDQFDLVTSLGLLEWLEDPLRAAYEMERVRTPSGKIVALVVNLSRFEETPISDEALAFYQEYLRGLHAFGCQTEQVDRYVQDIFSRAGIPTRAHEHVIESRVPITDELLESFLATRVTPAKQRAHWDFYYQFYAAVGWDRARFDSHVAENFAIEKEVEFLRGHVGEELTRRTPMVVLESVLNG
jgi:ubiquinone/menaquinone biosynthesis C-methylase UbiE